MATMNDEWGFYQIPHTGLVGVENEHVREDTDVMFMRSSPTSQPTSNTTACSPRSLIALAHIYCRINQPQRRANFRFPLPMSLSIHAVPLFSNDDSFLFSQASSSYHKIEPLFSIFSLFFSLLSFSTLFRFINNT